VTVIYSVIHDVLLDPLPYPDSDRFVNVLVQDTETGRVRGVLPAAEFLDYQQQSDVFEDVVGTRGESAMLTTAEGAEVLRIVRVTPNFFDVMGLRPSIGRTGGPDDARPDAAPVAILRHRAWVQYFESDPGVLGRTIRLNGEPRTIVGVHPGPPFAAKRLRRGLAIARANSGRAEADTPGTLALLALALWPPLSAAW
jgi:putative ABC transport system permease protein